MKFQVRSTHCLPLFDFLCLSLSLFLKYIAVTKMRQYIENDHEVSANVHSQVNDENVRTKSIVVNSRSHHPEPQTWLTFCHMDVVFVRSLMIHSTYESPSSFSINSLPSPACVTYLRAFFLSSECWSHKYTDNKQQWWVTTKATAMYSCSVPGIPQLHPRTENTCSFFPCVLLIFKFYDKYFRVI